MLSSGLITELERGKYSTTHQVVKVFIANRSFYHTEFFRFKPDARTIITIRHPDHRAWIFRARGHLLTEEQVKKFVPETSQSFMYFQKQRTLSLAAKDLIIQASKVSIDRGGRKIAVEGEKPNELLGKDRRSNKGRPLRML